MSQVNIIARSVMTTLAMMTLVCAPLAVQAGEPADYARDIAPIFKTNCRHCHGADEQQSGLRLDAGRLVLEGGNAGPAVVAGNAQASLLMRALLGTDGARRMPPEDEADPLTETEIAVVRRWIDEGAKIPPDEPIVPAKRKSDHWSFQPIVKPTPPPVQGESWVRNDIDRFVLARLEAIGLQAAPECDRRTLIRRLSLDLVGLPPTLAEVRAFEADTRPDAHSRLVERLLASPHYGERWGRHWLDLARYADSDGYSNDGPRVIWPYRDWVIDALNRDLPFDQFTIEQIAGDLLPNRSPQQVVATGFHRNTQLYSEANSATEEYRVENVVDRVHTTGVAFLGLTLGCARCHDHKFDPISQREFYELYAFFNNQDEPELPIETSTGKTTTLVMQERSTPRETHIHIRGEFLRLGRRVLPGVPTVLPPLATVSANGAGANGSTGPTRLDLAHWLVSPRNPLTPRVTVNRIWQVYFGRGLVETEDDFGLMGERPTHPELLDYLASELMAHGWSLKSLHRLIVNSATYRQSSAGRAELRDIDPRNELLARQNRLRLEAEMIRDAALEVSGLLSRKLKGPGVFPPQPEGVMRLTQTAGRQWMASGGEDRYRRGIYTYFWRLTPYPFLTLFNAPESNATCTRRIRSNTPLQALTLLNDEVFLEAAQALAARVLRELPAAAADERLAHAVRLCLGRDPSADELRVLNELLAAEEADAEPSAPLRPVPAVCELPPGVSRHQFLAWTAVGRALLNLDEFLTRE